MTTNSQPRVFIVSEPRKFEPGKGWVRSINLRPAQRFGELVFLLPPNNEAPLDPEPVLATLRAKLADFRDVDFLLLVGSPVYIAWASVIAAGHTRGKLRLLHWQREEQGYAVVNSDVLALACLPLPPAPPGQIVKNG